MAIRAHRRANPPGHRPTTRRLCHANPLIGPRASSAAQRRPALDARLRSRLRPLAGEDGGAQRSYLRVFSASAARPACCGPVHSS
jgi:hypothetical protein